MPLAPGRKTRMTRPLESWWGPSSENGSPCVPSPSARTAWSSSRWMDASLGSDMLRSSTLIDDPVCDGREAGQRDADPSRPVGHLIGNFISGFLDQKQFEQSLLASAAVASNRGAISIEERARHALTKLGDQ